MKKLPIPADSTQLLGKEFVGEEGRGANLIDLFGGAVEARRAVSSNALLLLFLVLCLETTSNMPGHAKGRAHLRPFRVCRRLQLHHKGLALQAGGLLVGAGEAELGGRPRREGVGHHRHRAPLLPGAAPWGCEPCVE